MSGRRNAYRTARSALYAVALLMLLGIVGSFLMGARAQSLAQKAATGEARTVAEKVLPAVFTTADLEAPVSATRAKEIADSLDSGGLATTPFSALTVWKDDGTIVYSTDRTQIGKRLPEEAARLRAAEQGTGSSRVVEGSYSTLLPLTLKSGATAVAQLDEPYAPLFSGSAKPWRLIAIALAILFVADLFAIWRVTRAAASAAANAAFRPTQGHTAQAPASAGPSKKANAHEDHPPYMQPGFREEADARRGAEERAKVAEQHLAKLQEQYQRSLEELQASQKTVTEIRSGRVDPALEQRVLKTEGQIRLLEGQLERTEAERDKLARELSDARAQPPAPAAGTEAQERLREMELDADALRAELEGARAELDVARSEAEAAEREREADRQRADEEKESILAQATLLQDERDSMSGELRAIREQLATIHAEADAAEHVRSELEAAREERESISAQLEAARRDAEDAQAELRVLRDGEERAAVLDEQLEAARAQLETTKTKHREQLETAAAKHREQLETARAELEALKREELEPLRTGLQSEEVRHQQELESALREKESLAAELEAARARHEEALAAKDAESDDLIERHRAELQAELDSIEAGLKEQLDARALEMRAQIGAAQEEVAATQGELDAARDLLAASEAERAEVLAQLDESRAALADREGEATAIRADLESAQARLASLEAELAGARMELDAVANDAFGKETQLAEVVAEKEAVAADLAAAAEEVGLLRREIGSAKDEIAALSETHTGAEGVLAGLQAELQAADRDRATAESELEAARAELVQAQAEIQSELARGVELAERADRADRELAALAEQQLVAPVEDPHRVDLQEVLRVTQERLAGNSKKLEEVEYRTRAAEREVEAGQARIRELEGEIRRAQIEKAIRQLRGEDVDGESIAASEPQVTDEMVDLAVAIPIEDRRGATPFMRELSLDAKKTLTQILGVTLTLRHKKAPHEQAPLLRQLAAFARRLDHTVSDLADADKLARGSIELNVRKTNMRALVERVIEESGAASDHDVRLETEELVIAVDPVRSEQILSALVRCSGDRTPPGAQITVRLSRAQGGALITVEDREPSSDASLSPIVALLTEVLGGWAKVESHPNGGSAFRAFLPDRSQQVPQADGEPGADEPGYGDAVGAGGEAPAMVPRRDKLEIVVDELPSGAEPTGAYDPWRAGQLLVQELQRLSRED